MGRHPELADQLAPSERLLNVEWPLPTGIVPGRLELERGNGAMAGREYDRQNAEITRQTERKWRDDARQDRTTARAAATTRRETAVLISAVAATLDPVSIRRLHNYGWGWEWIEERTGRTVEELQHAECSAAEYRKSMAERA